MRSLFDRLAEWWLIRRGRLASVKPNPLRLEMPSKLTDEEARELREEWKRRFG